MVTNTSVLLLIIVTFDHLLFQPHFYYFFIVKCMCIYIYIVCLYSFLHVFFDRVLTRPHFILATMTIKIPTNPQSFPEDCVPRYILKAKNGKYHFLLDDISPSRRYLWYMSEPKLITLTQLEEEMLVPGRRWYCTDRASFELQQKLGAVVEEGLPHVCFRHAKSANKYWFGPRHAQPEVEPATLIITVAELYLKANLHQIGLMAFLMQHIRRVLQTLQVFRSGRSMIEVRACAPTAEQLYLLSLLPGVGKIYAGCGACRVGDPRGELLLNGSGGIPIQTDQCVLALISGGIDSPVAAYRMMTRGCYVRGIHFLNSTASTAAVMDKNHRICAQLSRIQGSFEMCYVDISALQSHIVAHVPNHNRTLLYKWSMLALAAHFDKARLLVTGDSLGQVASQTLANMSTLYQHVAKPVAAPLVGMHKTYIMDEARRIGTYDYSIEEGEDCCQYMMCKKGANLCMGRRTLRACIRTLQRVCAALPVTRKSFVNGSLSATETWSYESAPEALAAASSSSMTTCTEHTDASGDAERGRQRRLSSGHFMSSRGSAQEGDFLSAPTLCKHRCASRGSGSSEPSELDEMDRDTHPDEGEEEEDHTSADDEHMGEGCKDVSCADAEARLCNTSTPAPHASPTHVSHLDASHRVPTTTHDASAASATAVTCASAATADWHARRKHHTALPHPSPSMPRLYMDAAAGTHMPAAVRAAMNSAPEGNPNSMHISGRQARFAMEQARSQLAEVLGLPARDIYFTSGGTESNNLALHGCLVERESWSHASTLPCMHNQCSSTLSSALPLTRVRVIDLVHHETGSVNRQLRRPLHGRLHVDACQALTKLDWASLDLREVDTLSISAHKFNGPTGVGALYVRAGVEVQPLFRGGSQEGGMRPGTENVPAIVGMGAALRLPRNHTAHRRMEDGVVSALSALGCEVNRRGETSGFIVHATLPVGMENTVLVTLLSSRYGVEIGTGSACKTNEKNTTVYETLGKAAAPDRAIRISWDSFTTMEEVHRLVAALRAAFDDLRARR